MRTYEIDTITEKTLATLRRAWSRPAPDGARRVRFEDLRFATEKTLAAASTTGDHLRRVVALLDGTLDESLAPCVRAAPSTVAPVACSQVDWHEVTPQTLRALTSMGLAPDVWRRVSGEESDDGDERAEVRRLVHELVTLLGADGGLVAVTEAVGRATREALLAQALEASAGHRTRAAEALACAPSRVAQLLVEFPHLAERWPSARGRTVNLDGPASE